MLHNVARPVAIDLFAGAGGLSLGLQQAGFRVGAAVDNDAVAVQTYANNLGKHILEATIENVSASELMSLAGVVRGECALLAGGPPCQGFSLQRRGERADPRNQLVLDFVRMIEEIRPAFFLMENVGGLLTKHGRPFLDEFEARIGAIGYMLHIRLLDAADYEVPQRRKRVFLVGERIAGKQGVQFQFPEATSWLKPRTVRHAIKDLPSPPQDGSLHLTLPNHFREKRLSALNVTRIMHVPPGGGRESLPEYLQLDCHKNNAKHRHLDVYGRLAWDEPSVTLTARFDSFTRGRFAHPEEHRSLTIREGARIQTFPDWFVFQGNREEQARQVGNAVPPLLAARLGEAVLRVFDAIGEDSVLAA